MLNLIFGILFLLATLAGVALVYMGNMMSDAPPEPLLPQMAFCLVLASISLLFFVGWWNHW
jgi:hypothetical protein